MLYEIDKFITKEVASLFKKPVVSSWVIIDGFTSFFWCLLLLFFFTRSCLSTKIIGHHRKASGIQIYNILLCLRCKYLLNICQSIKSLRNGNLKSSIVN